VLDYFTPGASYGRPAASRVKKALWVGFHPSGCAPSPTAADGPGAAAQDSVLALPTATIHWGVARVCRLLLTGFSSVYLSVAVVLWGSKSSD
jgi:hypothetical protein